MTKLNKYFAALSVALLSTSAIAADLPSSNYSQPQSYEQSSYLFSWTGFYAGLNLGYGWPDSDQNAYYDVGSVHIPRLGSSDDGSMVFGAQIGYNHQLNERFVVGVEADLNFSNFKSNLHSRNFQGIGFTGDNLAVKTTVDWFGTLRARFGFVPTERLMIYGTAGIAYAGVETKASDTIYWNGAPYEYGDSSSDVRWGWTLGAGAEYALTQNITAKLEYSYVDLEEDKLFVGTTNRGFLAKDDPSFHMMRVGVNYKF
jgi:Opacity protein and related surface antigens